MKRISQYLTILLLLFPGFYNGLSGQEFHPGNLIQGKSNPDALYESRNGFRLPVSGTVRVLFVFAEYDYINGGDPTPGEGTAGWPSHSLPAWADSLADAYPPAGNPTGVLTGYYRQASSGSYTILGDYLLAPDNGGVFRVQTDSAHAIAPDNASLINEVNKKLQNSIITAHGLNGISYFDLWSIPDNEFGLPKKSPSDENPGKYDHIIFIWRNSAYDGIGDYSFSSPGIMLGYGANTYSWFGTRDRQPTQIMIHEYAHLLYGGLDFHCGGGGWFTGGDYWIPATGGWSNLGLSGSSLMTWNAWDRLRLDWKAPGNMFPVSARNESGTEEVNGDLDAANPAQAGIYTLRDFVTTGDAVRIKLPYLDPDKEFPEYLWLENHNTESMNQCRWDKFLWQDGNSCVQPAIYGLYAYMQADRETRSGRTFDDVFKGFAYFLRPVTAEGFYDKEFEANSVLNNCVNSSPMFPFTRLPENSNPLTGSGDQEFYAVDWNHDDILDHRDQYYTNIENIGGEYCKCMYNNGHSRNVFTLNGNHKIGMGTNPSSSSMMTMVGYDTPVEGANNVRKIYLNGISVEMISQDSDGTIKVKVRFDDVSLNEDVRWCADEIVLNPIVSSPGFSLNLDNGRTLILDQGTTATRMTDPSAFNCRKIFTSPTEMVVNEDAVLHLSPDSRIILKNASSLTFRKGSSCIVENGGLIQLQSGTTLVFDEGSKLVIKGNGKLIARPLAKLCISLGAECSFREGLHNLEAGEGVIIPAGCYDLSGEAGIQVYPNPAEDFIEIDYMLSSGNIPAELAIYDARGRVAARLTLEGKQGKKVFETNRFGSGIYFYRLTGNERISGKFIIR